MPEQRCARTHGFERSSGTCQHKGQQYKEPSNTAQLAPKNLLAKVHDSLEHNSLKHTRWPGWRPSPETSIEKLPREQRRQHRREHGLGVFQYTCESLQARVRLYELMALAKRKGATVVHQLGAWSDSWPSFAVWRGRRAGDVYLISACAPVHDERTQTVASESLRLKSGENWTESFVRSQADAE